MTTERCIARAWMVVVLTAGCGGGGGGNSEGGTTGGDSSSGGAAETSTGDEQVTTGNPVASTTEEPETGGSSSSGGEDGPEPPAAYETWLKVELPGTVCGNNSQYKFFVNYKEGAKDLMIMLEPGGACWDYDGCSGKSDLGAAHPDGIPDDLMKDSGQSANISPLIRRDVEGPTQDFNLVYVPYCTGDVHTGNNVMIVRGPRRRRGPARVPPQRPRPTCCGSIDYLSAQFPASSTACS
jgi:hypothetical protein